MARRELGQASLSVAKAVAAALPKQAFVVGCSGGADSLALTLGARWAANRAGVEFTALVIDHGLQEGSAAVAAQTVDKLSMLGISAVAERVAVDDGNLEAEARRARLAALAARGRPVLLGHTLDDQAETVLLGLARGSGLTALAGMAPVRGPFIRPLLGITGATTRAACDEWGVPPWNDPHNDDPRFARVRARNTVLPMLERELGPGIAAALARTAELTRLELAALAELTPSAANEPAVEWLANLGESTRVRVLKAWLEQRARDVSFGQVRAVETLVTAWRGQAGIDLVGGRVVRRAGHLSWQGNAEE